MYLQSCTVTHEKMRSMKLFISIFFRPFSTATSAKSLSSLAKFNECVMYIKQVSRRGVLLQGQRIRVMQRLPKVKRFSFRICAWYICGIYMAACCISRMKGHSFVCIRHGTLAGVKRLFGQLEYLGQNVERFLVETTRPT